VAVLVTLTIFNIVSAIVVVGTGTDNDKPRAAYFHDRRNGRAQTHTGKGALPQKSWGPGFGNVHTKIAWIKMTDFVVTGITIEVALDPDVFATKIQPTDQQGTPFAYVVIIHIDFCIKDLGL